MKVEFEMWQLVSLALMLTGTFTGLGKYLLTQHARQIERSLEHIHADSKKWVELEREFYKHLAELPVAYVRREDYVRGQSVIEAKLDSIAGELKIVQIQGGAKS